MRAKAGLKFEPTVIPVEAAAVEAAIAAAAETPPPLDVVVPPPDGAEMLGIEGTEV